MVWAIHSLSEMTWQVNSPDAPDTSELDRLRPSDSILGSADKVTFNQALRFGGFGCHVRYADHSTILWELGYS